VRLYQHPRRSDVIDRSVQLRLCEKDGVLPLMLHARYEKARVEHRIVDVAVRVAIGVREAGEGHVLGVSVVHGETRTSWGEFIGGLRSSRSATTTRQPYGSMRRLRRDRERRPRVLFAALLGTYQWRVPTALRLSSRLMVLG
jgi:hypothetical protein